MSTDLWSLAADLRLRGTPFAFATVVRAEAPTSAKPGDKAILTAEGLLAGWVGGSCAEPVVREEAEAALRDGQPRLVCITPEVDGFVARLGDRVHAMTCFSGGALDVWIEPHLPEPLLLVFGNSPIAQSLVDLAAVLRWRAAVVDRTERPALSAPTVVRRVDELPTLVPSHTFAVVSTHGVFDADALASVAAMDLAYVGLVASRRRREEVLDLLRGRGVDEGALARIRSPAGFDLGAQGPGEVAVSIVAEIVAERRGKALVPATLAVARAGG